MLCVVMKVLSHASAKRATKRLKLLLVVFKWHHGSEGVKGAETESEARLGNEMRKEAGSEDDSDSTPRDGFGNDLTA